MRPSFSLTGFSVDSESGCLSGGFGEFTEITVYVSFEIGCCFIYDQILAPFF